MSKPWLFTCWLYSARSGAKSDKTAAPPNLSGLLSVFLKSGRNTLDCKSQLLAGIHRRQVLQCTFLVTFLQLILGIDLCLEHINRTFHNGNDSVESGV